MLQLVYDISKPDNNTVYCKRFENNESQFTLQKFKSPQTCKKILNKINKTFNGTAFAIKYYNNCNTTHSLKTRKNIKKDYTLANLIVNPKLKSIICKSLEQNELEIAKRNENIYIRSFQTKQKCQKFLQKWKLPLNEFIKNYSQNCNPFTTNEHTLTITNEGKFYCNRNTQSLNTLATFPTLYDCQKFTKGKQLGIQNTINIKKGLQPKSIPNLSRLKDRKNQTIALYTNNSKCICNTLEKSNPYTIIELFKTNEDCQNFLKTYPLQKILNQIK